MATVGRLNLDSAANRCACRPISEIEKALREMAGGDRIELEVGDRTVAGAIVETTDAGVILEVSGRHRTYAFAEIDDVVLSASTAPPE